MESVYPQEVGALKDTLDSSAFHSELSIPIPSIPIPYSVSNPHSLFLQIVMHLLSTYLDNHLPPDPWFPDGKTFSTQYFLKAPPKNGA